MTRREWHKRVVGGILAAALPRGRGLLAAADDRAAAATVSESPAGAPLDPRYKGVVLGVQSYSFRDRDLDAAIQAMVRLGIGSCELYQGHVEPQERATSRDALRRWRETVSLDVFTRVREKFSGAGIALSAYNYSFRDDFSDFEIERGFEMTKALGAPVITASATVSSMKRVAPIARRHEVRVAVHNHSNLDPNEFATPASFEQAMREGGEVVAINLDIGHFTAANFDAVAFLQRYHSRIATLHLKDRRRDQGPNVPFGQGDTPIGPVLRLLRDNGWPIAANVEYEYQGSDTVEEVRRSLEYCRSALDAA